MRTLLLIVALLGLAGQPPQREAARGEDRSGRIVLFFVDDLHLNFRDTGRIRLLFQKIAAELIHDGDRFAMVSTGPSSIAVDLTADRQKLDDAIKKIAGAGLKPEEIAWSADAAAGGSEVHYRAHVALATALETLQKIGQVENRRKTVVYVSNGYDFDQPAKSGDEWPAAQLRAELNEVVREATRAKTTVYTIDARALAGAADTAPKGDRLAVEAHVRQTQSSLRDLAEPTGGIGVLNADDLAYALKRIVAHTSNGR